MTDILKFKLKRWEMLMLAIVHFYLMLCPYNKVEESFNTQAIHDIIYNTKYIYYYDHISFPGPVPRTFLGALTVALPSSLLIFLTRCSKAVGYSICRGFLGLFVVWSFSTFRRAVKKAFGSTTANCLIAVTCSQFHFLFYASRTLPNTFGMCCLLVSAAYWINKEWESFLWTAGFGVMIFRSELIILLGPMLLAELIRGKLTFKELLAPGFQTAGIILLACCSIDTYLWRYTVWPEAVVLYYNTWLNKSSEWGTQPLLWYFYSALPRSMLLALPLTGFGCLIDRRILQFSIPPVIFLALYSLLPHKELRFILYAIPLLNVGAAYVMSLGWKKGMPYRLVVGVGITANLLACSGFLSASYHNYPGGPAFEALHSLAPCSQNTTVFIGNYAAQNGVSRFGEKCDSLFERRWNYVKTDGLTIAEIRKFQLLLVEPKETPEFRLTHLLVETFYVHSGFELKLDKFPYIHTKVKPAIHLLKPKKFFVIKGS